MTLFQIPKNRLVVNDLMASGAEELSDHALRLAHEIREGRYEKNGDLSLKVVLGHLMDHVVIIWHQSKTTDHQEEAESQNEYEEKCLKIPRLQDGYELIDAD